VRWVYCPKMAYGALTMRSTVMGDTPSSPAILRRLSIRPGLCLSSQNAINRHALCGWGGRECLCGPRRAGAF